MRFHLGFPHDGAERAARGAMVERIDAYWAEALARVRSLTAAAGNGEVLRLEAAMRALLARVHEGLDVELDGAPPEVGWVLGPRDAPELEQLALEVVARAPAGVVARRHRAPMDLSAAVDDVRARTGLDLSAARARIGFSRGHLLEVVLHAPSVTSAVDDAALDAANLLLPRLIGGDVFDDWIGAVEVAPLPRGGPLLRVSEPASSSARVHSLRPAAPDAAPLALAEVAPAVGAAVRAAESALPADPWYVARETAVWVLLELEPRPADDYAALDDLALLSTPLPEAFKSFLEGARFSSRRFSRHGERFVYLKVDAAMLTPPSLLDHRDDLERALNAALVPARLGAVVGAGRASLRLPLRGALALRARSRGGGRRLPRAHAEGTPRLGPLLRHRLGRRMDHGLGRLLAPARVTLRGSSRRARTPRARRARIRA